MLWDELRWCRCWIITPLRGIANTCRGVRERGFLGLKASMPRTEELSGRKYTVVWIRSAIIRSRAGPGPPVNSCDVNEQWHDNDITHSYSWQSREVKCEEISVKITRTPDEEIMIATDAVGGEPIKSGLKTWTGKALEVDHVAKDFQREKSETAVGS